MNKNELVSLALSARENSYSPYSGFKVGAALLTKNGKVYKGCNIENGAFSPTNCAERTAVFTAIADGEKEFKAIAVVGGADEIKNFCPPCGVCRQVLSEFCKEDFEIHLFNGEEIKTFTLGELLPESFNL
ncbi:MAG: cytidine deaminase [Clostridia bacterium]|nr:cytidine deaminase [Clostridia bacterium]